MFSWTKNLQVKVKEASLPFIYLLTYLFLYFLYLSMDSLFSFQGVNPSQFEFDFSTLITCTLPFIQGDDWHSSMSTSQSIPV